MAAIRSLLNVLSTSTELVAGEVIHTLVAEIGVSTYQIKVKPSAEANPFSLSSGSHAVRLARCTDVAYAISQRELRKAGADRKPNLHRVEALAESIKSTLEEERDCDARALALAEAQVQAEASFNQMSLV